MRYLFIVLNVALAVNPSIIDGQTQLDAHSQAIFNPRVGMDLLTAESQGYVTASYRSRGGSSGATVNVTVRRVKEKAGDATLYVTAPRGLLLTNSNTSEQAMAVVGFAQIVKVSVGYIEKKIFEMDGESTTINLEAYCAELHKNNPSPDAILNARNYDPMLMCLARPTMYSMGLLGIDFSQVMLIKQAAIWQYTDNASFGEFEQRLGAQTSPQILSSSWRFAADAVRACRMIDPVTLLRNGAADNDISLIKEAFLRHVDVNARRESNDTALHLAAQNGRIDATLALLDAGANIDAKMAEGWTPLLLAISASKLDVARLLIGRKANLNLSNSSGSTALHLAASQNDEGLVRTLIEAGADPTRKDEDGLTPEKIAASEGHEVLRAYLSTRLGSEPTLQPGPPSSGIGNPENSNSVASVGLDKARANANALVRLVSQRDVVGIKAMLASGADPNAVDNSYVRGWTPLMEAARAGDAEITKVLLGAHAKAGATNEYGGTALKIAVANGHPDVAAIIENSVRTASRK